jgi:folate-binding protein YgfZ
MSHQTLTHRGVIKVSGVDKVEFLQGIISNDVRLIDENKAIYSWFLTPQGKYLADFFIVAKGDDWFLDVDQSLLDDLMRRLAIYKLRSKVTLENVSHEYKVVAYWEVKPDNNTILYFDPRLSQLGWRALVITDQLPIEDEADYNYWRLQHGVPDSCDFIRERSIMLECNMDLLNAISWDKGCYMGQELTARTHYRALIKKRLIPLRFQGDIDLPMDTPILRNGKEIGVLRSCHRNLAIALLALESLQDGEILMAETYPAQVCFAD